MVAITIDADFPDIRRKLKTLQADVADKATKRALDRTVEQGKAEMTRRIREEFNLPAGKVREKLFVKRASFARGRLGLEAVLFSRDASGKRRAINLINFQARETRQGLSFKVKRSGGRSVIKQGFIGNKGRTAFIREGKKRLPIKALQTIDVPQMFNTRRINQAVVRKLRDVFPAVFERELRFYTAKFRGAR